MKKPNKRRQKNTLKKMLRRDNGAYMTVMELEWFNRNYVFKKINDKWIFYTEIQKEHTK